MFTNSAARPLSPGEFWLIEGDIRILQTGMLPIEETFWKQNVIPDFQKTEVDNGNAYTWKPLPLLQKMYKILNLQRKPQIKSSMHPSL
jgi:hypothetical protein